MSGTNAKNDVASSSADDVPSEVDQEQPLPPSADPPADEMEIVGETEDDERMPQLPIPVCTPAQAANTLTRKELEHLFIDTTFYARLGFLQPPCCVKCAYDDARKGVHYMESFAEKGCGRLVLWRRDISLPIHPDHMQTNSVVITCDTAKALMRGETVGGVRWDKTKSALVFS